MDMHRFNTTETYWNMLVFSVTIQTRFTALAMTTCVADIIKSSRKSSMTSNGCNDAANVLDKTRTPRRFSVCLNAKFALEQLVDVPGEVCR
jgi:hypothetical protein